MRKHGDTPSRRDKHVTPAAISPSGVAQGRYVRGQQSGLAGCKPPPLFTRGASSCSSQGRRQGEPRGASPRPSAPIYLPPKEQADEIEDRYKSVSTLAWSWSTGMGTTPNNAAPVSWWLNLGLQPNGW